LFTLPFCCCLPLRCYVVVALFVVVVVVLRFAVVWFSFATRCYVCCYVVRLPVLHLRLFVYVVVVTLVTFTLLHVLPILRLRCLRYALHTLLIAFGCCCVHVWLFVVRLLRLPRSLFVVVGCCFGCCCYVTFVVVTFAGFPRLLICCCCLLPLLRLFTLRLRLFCLRCYVVAFTFTLLLCVVVVTLLPFVVTPLSRCSVAFVTLGLFGCCR